MKTGTRHVTENFEWMAILCTLSLLSADALRLPYRNDAKIAEICNLWTFWPVNVIQPISHLFKI